MCQPRKLGTVGAEPFSAKLRYTGAEDPGYANLIKLTVTMPHIDGETIISPGWQNVGLVGTHREPSRISLGKNCYYCWIYALFAVKTTYYSQFRTEKTIECERCVNTSKCHVMSLQTKSKSVKFFVLPAKLIFERGVQMSYWSISGISCHEACFTSEI